ncbi:MAG: alpha/beta hydrolase [Phycisphaerales bacterium]
MATPASPITASSPAPRRGSLAWRRQLARLGVLVGAVYGCWCGGLWLAQGTLVFPRHVIPPHATDPVPGATQLAITTEGGLLVPAILLVPPRREPGQRFPLVVWCHGNAETVDQAVHLDEVQVYLRHRMAVLLPEYRGYGRAAGSPSQAAISDDLTRFYDLAIAREEIDPARVAFFGRSLGGAVAVQLAALRKPRALVLQSTFTSITSFANGYGVPGFIVSSPFRTDRVLPTLSVPLLIMHGDRDTIVPVWHGRHLRELVPAAEYFEQPADHLDFPSDFGEYEGWVIGFLERAGVVPGP